jgi:hypothetical protein
VLLLLLLLLLAVWSVTPLDSCDSIIIILDFICCPFPSFRRHIPSTTHLAMLLALSDSPLTTTSRTVAR